MTTQPKPDLAAIVAAVYEFRQNLAAAARRAWPRVAAALNPTQDEFALVPNDVAHEQPKPDHKRDLAALWALAACLNGDDQHAARLLAGLDAAQLYAIEGAASGLAIHASRHRKRLDEAEQDGPAAAGRRVSVDEYERLLAADEQTAARVEHCRCGVAITPDGDHWTHIGDADPFHFPEPAPQDDDEQTPDEQPMHDDCAACGTGTTDTHGDHAAPDWRAAYDRLAAKTAAQDGDERPEEDRRGTDHLAGRALHDRLRDAVADLVDAESVGPVTAAVWEPVAYTVADYRDEARVAVQRAKDAERRLDVVTRERDRIRQRADRADRVEATLASARKEVEKAAAAGWDVVRIPAMRAALSIPDGTDAPDAWRP